VENEAGEYVCAKCGTVVAHGVEAEMMKAYTKPDEFIKDQFVKTRNTDLSTHLAKQTFAIIKERKHGTENIDKTYKELNKQYAQHANFEKDKYWSIGVVDDKVILFRRTWTGAKVVRAIVDFADYPKQLILKMVVAKTSMIGNYNKKRVTLYETVEHRIEFSPEVQRKINDRKIKNALVALLSFILLKIFANDENDPSTRKSSRREKTIANMIAYFLMRIGAAPKAWKMENGKLVYHKYDAILVDSKPLSGKKVADPLITMQYKDPERAKEIREFLRKMIERFKQGSSQTVSDTAPNQSPTQTNQSPTQSPPKPTVQRKQTTTQNQTKKSKASTTKTTISTKPETKKSTIPQVKHVPKEKPATIIKHPLLEKIETRPKESLTKEAPKETPKAERKKPEEQANPEEQAKEVVPVVNDDELDELIRELKEIDKKMKKKNKKRILLLGLLLGYMP